MRTLSLLLSLTLLSTATTAQDTAPDAADSTYSQVPLMLEGGYALVPVSIDGLDSLLFVLDTAASASVVSPATRDALGFSEDEGGIAQVLGASGPTEYQLLELDALTVGGRTERGLRVAVIDLDRFEQGETTYAGILGNDVLRRFDVEYDRPGAVLGLYAQGTVPPERLAGTEAVPFAGGGFGGFIRFDATLGGAPVTAIVDTGA
ncbi:MAG: retropepsin-like aspartic protease, partial [Bacteroidota bacterium]